VAYELTTRQREVLDYIAQFIIDNQYAPSMREIGAAMGISSTNGVNDHLEALKRKGYLLHSPAGAKSRVIRLSSRAKSMYPPLSARYLRGRMGNLQRLVDGFPQNILDAVEGCETPLDGAAAVLDLVDKILKEEY
jgi:SOS-response transcriptional repressor LexA